VTWLIDTNVISEIRKGARCHPGVAAWWAGVEDRGLFLSALTLGEIRKGVEGARPRDPAKAAALESWIAEVADAFGPRVLGVDAAAAEAWGRVSAARSVLVIDALLAATAGVHGLVLVTRSIVDVEGLSVRALDPFAAAPR
jgi:toxin FitB